MESESPNPLSGLGSTKSTYRLNQIDKAQANGIGDVVSLPQVAVFGDQSSGKSSVLERLTGFPFPREEGLCTRFPTEIILRHNSEPLKLTASIRPTISRSLSEKKRFKAYRHTLKDISELPNVIRESAAMMGLRGYGQDPDMDRTANAFAHDVLRIEISGPVGLHLTIVDLPGLISVPNEEQTEDDVLMVTAIAEKYLKSTRTIIMAVVQASNDVANQRVIQLARKHDADGGRTVGIITKPDLINIGAEPRIAKLASNRDSVKLKLGFFLVKNPSPSENKTAGATESQDESAQRERDFFNKPAWKKQNLAAERVGIDALRLYVQELLDRHIEKELPKVRDEIRRQLAVKEKELAAMGVQRQTCSDVRYFLTSTSMRFHSLAEAALYGNYMGAEADFFKGQGTRLRSLVHDANRLFAETMRVRGQLRKIIGPPDPKEPPKCAFKFDEEGDDELTDETRTHSQIEVTREEMTTWVHEIYKTTRGRELPGTHNHVLLEELFREQSSLWPSLASDHVQAILKMVLDWASKAFHVCGQEENVRNEIWTLCRYNIQTTRVASLDELRKLIGDEKQHPITYNHYYTDNVQKAETSDNKATVEEILTATSAMYASKTESYRMQLIEKITTALGENTAITPDMDEQACRRALVELEAYYKVAMKTFVDNVCRQVIERHIMTALPDLFSPKMVATLSDEELLRIGSETEAQKTKRAELQTLISGLRQSLVDLLARA